MKKGFASFLFNRGSGGASSRGGTSPRGGATAASDSLQALDRFMESFGHGADGAVLHSRSTSLSDAPVAVMHEGWTGAPSEGDLHAGDSVTTSSSSSRAADDIKPGGRDERSSVKIAGGSSSTEGSSALGEGDRSSDGDSPQRVGTGSSSTGKRRPPTSQQQQDDDDDDDDDPSLDVTDGLVPTFHQVAFPMVLRLAEASLDSLERLVAYVEERWKLEHRFARERMRTHLEFRHGARMADDSLENCMQAMALYQDVESTQSYAVVEKMEQVVRAPLLKLREDLSRVVNECRTEWRACEKDVEGLERRVAKAKLVLNSRREKRVEIREKLDYYSRLAEELGAATGPSNGGGGGGGGGGASGAMNVVATLQGQQSGRGDSIWDIDRFLLTPNGGSGGGGGGTGFSLFDERPDRENLETTILPRLQRQLVEAESDIRTTAGSVELSVHQLLEGLARLDNGHVRWTEIIQKAEEERRKVLQRVASDYLMLQMRSSQISFAQLDRLGRMLEQVDNHQDLQRFVEVHSAVGGGGGGGTPMRSTALRLMPIGIDDLLPPKLMASYIAPSATSSTSSPVRQRDASLSITSLSPPSSPERSERSSSFHSHHSHVEEKEPFDEKEDTEVLTILVKQLVLANPPPPTQPPSSTSSASSSRSTSTSSTPEKKRASPPPPPSSNANTHPASAPGLPRKESFNWEGLDAAVGEKGGSGTGTLYATDGERKRFFARIFSGSSCQGRSAFLQELNQYRSKKTDVGDGFRELGDVMWCLLTECQRHSDVHNAKMAMMLSQTFWHVGGGSKARLPPQPPPPPLPPTAEAASAPPLDANPQSGGVVGRKGATDELGESVSAADERSRREFLSNRLMGHPLWSDAAFWDQALWQCVLEQIPTIELSHGGPWHDLTGEARDDVVRRVQNIIFSQAGTLGYSMLEFGVDIPDAADFICRVAERHQLSEDMKYTLLRHLFLHAQQLRPRGSRASSLGR